ncbi:hypothetical protein GEMRC1_000545 [Eukaryota sp. GEM-RC1]
MFVHCYLGELSKSGKVIFGRNYDYHEAFFKLSDCLVETTFVINEMSFTTFGWAGCLYATTGCNSHGVFVELNDATWHDLEMTKLGHKSPNRMDYNLLPLLVESKTIEDGERWLLENLPNFSYLIGLANEREARCYLWNRRERIPHVPFIQGYNNVVFANHYFNDPWDLPEYEDYLDSIPRMNYLQDNVQRMDVDEMIELIKSSRVYHTVYQIVWEHPHFVFIPIKK